MLRAQQLVIFTFDLVRYAAGSFKPADNLSEGTSYFRQICGGVVYKQAKSSTVFTPSATHNLRTAEVVICIISEKTARSPSTVTARRRFGESREGERDELVESVVALFSEECDDK